MSKELFFEQHVYNDKLLRRTIRGLYNKYKGGMSSHITLEEFTKEQLAEVYIILQGFELRDGGTWENISPANKGRFFKTVNTTLGFNLYIELNNVKTMKRDGRTVAVKLLTQSTSNNEFPIDTAEDFWRGTLSEEQAEQRLSHFNQWFLDNRHQVLTDNQNRFIDNMAKAMPSDYTDNTDFQDITGVNTKNKAARLRSINERIMKNYKPMSVSPELRQLNHVHELINNEANTHNMNKLLRQWINMNKDTDFLSFLLADNLNGTENAEVNGYISTPLLYKIADLLERRRDVLLENSSYVPQKIKSTFTHKPQHKEHMFGECKVFKASTGEFLRIEEPCETKRTGKNVYELTAQGVEVIDQ